MIKKISKVKFEEMQADLDNEATMFFLCMHKLLIERHGWKEDELHKEIRRMMKNSAMEFPDLPVGNPEQ